jgi:hypothetical protein
LIAHNVFGVEDGVSEVVAHHATSQSAFITAMTATRPASFQRVSLHNQPSVALTSHTIASNLQSGVTTAFAALNTNWRLWPS